MEFPLDIRTELNLGGIWTDISPDVYLRETKNIVRGLRDQGSAADPSTLGLTLNNRAGKYSPRNAMSPLFGQLGRNTPIRVSVPGSGDSYLQLESVDGCAATTPDTAALDITGDLDVRVEVSANWYGPGQRTLIGKWESASLNSSWLFLLADGQLTFRRDQTGDSHASFFYRRPLPTLPDRAVLRATFDADNGAGGTTVTLYWAEEWNPSEWTMIDQPVTVEGVHGIYASTAPLTVGVTDYNFGTSLRLPIDGRVYRAEVRNGINGVVVASPDFRALADGSTGMTDSAGRTWSLTGSAQIRDREDRFIGEVSTWPLRWSTDDADVWSPITAYGPMHRMGQGVKALESSLRRRIPSGNPVAYWPMEEQQEATRAFSPIPGVLPASVSSVDWAALNTLPSSAPLPQLSGASSLAAPVPAFDPGAWQVEFIYNANEQAPADTGPPGAELISFHSADGTVRRWRIGMSSGRCRVRGYDVNNVEIVTRNVNIGADVFQGWVRLRFWAQDSSTPGTFSWQISWQDVGGEAGAFGTSESGTCGSLYHLSADWPAETEGWGIGHLSVLAQAGSTLYDGSDDAYRGETAWERMTRLATEEGFNVSRTPGRLPVTPVGFQRADSMLNVLEDAANGDGGLLTEDMNRVGLHYRDRSSIYSQEPLITLSYNAPGLGPDIEPVDDDSDVVNDVTVTRDGGSSARAVLDTGPLSVADIGKYDASYSLSLAEDEQTGPLAYWKLHLGTHDGARYPTISFLLHKPGAAWLIPLVHRLREGDKIRITDLPEWVSHDDVDLLVMGWSEQLDMYQWEVTLNCVPAGPWDTAITDHALYGKVDTDGSAVATAATSTATSLVVRTADGPMWTDDPAELPYNIRAGGEVMTVTAVGPSVADTFTRTVANGWGTATSGQSWQLSGGPPASHYSVNGTKGVQAINTRNIFYVCSLPSVSLMDAELTATWTMPVLPTGDGIYTYFMIRTDSAAQSYYFARVWHTTTGKAQLSLRKRTPTETLLGTYGTDLTHVAGQTYKIRFRVEGSTISAKFWIASGQEPAAWQVVATDADPLLARAGGVGVRTFTGATNTNTLPVAVTYDDVTVTDSQAFTVVRSVNGVIKPQAVGTAVNVATPAITSL